MSVNDCPALKEETGAGVGSREKGRILSEATVVSEVSY